MKFLSNTYHVSIVINFRQNWIFRQKLDFYKCVLEATVFLFYFLSFIITNELPKKTSRVFGFKAKSSFMKNITYINPEAILLRKSKSLETWLSQGTYGYVTTKDKRESHLALEMRACLYLASSSSHHFRTKIFLHN